MSERGVQKLDCFHGPQAYRRQSRAPHAINMLRDNHFKLVTLGRLTLAGSTDEEDASLAKQRRKLALLAVLAMARRPIARDTLVEMFWGEQDEARARHSLSNALSCLRRRLGAKAITTRDAEVALSSDVPMVVDALELASRCTAGRSSTGATSTEARRSSS
jgi:DNA-binding SARP family transcriptional activator